MTCVCVSPCGRNIRDEFARSKQHLRNYFVNGDGRGLHSPRRSERSQGTHRLLITFADPRNRDRTVLNSRQRRDYPTPWVVWKGEAPVIEVFGPGLPKQPLPAVWLRCEK